MHVFFFRQKEIRNFELCHADKYVETLHVCDIISVPCYNCNAYLFRSMPKCCEIRVQMSSLATSELQTRDICTSCRPTCDFSIVVHCAECNEQIYRLCSLLVLFL